MPPPRNAVWNMKVSQLLRTKSITFWMGKEPPALLDIRLVGKQKCSDPVRIAALQTARWVQPLNRIVKIISGGMHEVSSPSTSTAESAASTPSAARTPSAEMTPSAQDAVRMPGRHQVKRRQASTPLLMNTAPSLIVRPLLVRMFSPIRTPVEHGRV
jgi:hypothetical protein